MEKEFLLMTVEELKKYAKRKKINFNPRVKKAELIELILINECQRMKVEKLKEYAKNNDIRLMSTDKKDVIIERILEKMKKNISLELQKEKKDPQNIKLVTKPGRTIIRKARGVGCYRHNVYTICEECGEEVQATYLSHKEDGDEYSAVRAKLKDVLAKCPKCEKKLGLINGRYIRQSASVDRGGVFNELRKLIEENKKSDFREKLVVLRNENDNKNGTENIGVQSISKSVENLKTYILYLIHAETAIHFLNEYLVELQLKELDNKQSLVRSKLFLIKYGEEEQESLLSQKEEIERVLEDPYKYVDENELMANWTKISPVMPKKISLKKPVEPKYPEMKKPGLFNKNKILLENERLIRLYEEEKKNYEVLLEQYEQKQKEYLEEVKLYKEKQNLYVQEYKEEKEMCVQREVERIIKENRDKLEEIEEKLKGISKFVDDKINNLPQSGIKEFLKNEQKSVKAELKKVTKIRDQLYSYNIIYTKYRNYVALTSFYEYLNAGRCASLEGAYGCYNLYESELRSDEIMWQLNKIVDSLEMIKANQSLLYKELKQVNNNLMDIKGTLSSVLDSLSAIQYDTYKMLEVSEATAAASIATAQNTAVTAYYSAVTAHYSAETAHYSKINAELTNALGFMIAMK